MLTEVTNGHTSLFLGRFWYPFSKNTRSKTINGFITHTITDTTVLDLHIDYKAIEAISLTVSVLEILNNFLKGLT